MTTQTFIEKAIEGGWDLWGNWHKGLSVEVTDDGMGVEAMFYEGEYPEEGSIRYDVEKILLDCEAWQAVGKVEGWSEEETKRFFPRGMGGMDSVIGPVWLCQMHRMIDALADGKSIDEYLETL